MVHLPNVFDSSALPGTSFRLGLGTKTKFELSEEQLLILLEQSPIVANKLTDENIINFSGGKDVIVT